MMIKAGFHVQRDTTIKVIGPIVDYFSKKNCEITLFCDYRTKASKLGYKAYQFPAIEKMPRFGRNVNCIAFHTVNEFVNSIKSKSLNVMFFLNANQLGSELKKEITRTRYSLLIAQLQYSIEFIYLSRDLSYSDVIYTYGELWNGWWKSYIKHHGLVPESRYAEFCSEVDKKSVPVGYPEADQILHFKKNEIKKKYNIPENKKILVFFPFAWNLPFNVWTHIIYRPQPNVLKYLKLILKGAIFHLNEVNKGIDDLILTKAILKFIKKNNGFFIVKGRKKNKIPQYLRTMADRVFFDESYYPFMTLELLAVADLSLSFYSSVIFESAISRTPSICLAPINGGDWPGYDDRRFLNAFSPNQGSFYNYSGVVYYESVDEFIRKIPFQTFENYYLNSDSADDFIKKYMNYSDYKASSRIYDDIYKKLESN